MVSDGLSKSDSRNLNVWLPRTAATRPLKFLQRHVNPCPLELPQGLLHAFARNQPPHIVELASSGLEERKIRTACVSEDSLLEHLEESLWPRTHPLADVRLRCFGRDGLPKKIRQPAGEP